MANLGIGEGRGTGAGAGAGGPAPSAIADPAESQRRPIAAVRRRWSLLAWGKGGVNSTCPQAIG